VFILVGVVAVVLFPLWPYELKYFLFRACLFLLIGLLAILVLRVGVYMFMAIFGVSFWVFPRFLEADSTLDSFRPLYSFKKWTGSSRETLIVRLVLLGIFFYYGFHIISDPSMLRCSFPLSQKI
jgi:hypothetical protein